MQHSSNWISLVARATRLATSHGMSGWQVARAMQRMLRVSSSLSAATRSPSQETRRRFVAGVSKNLHDDPMLVLWALRLASELSDRAWSRFFENFVVRAVVDRRAAIESNRAELGFPPPVTLVINPTMACNLRCRGCYAFQYGRDSAMEPAFLRKILQDAHDLGVRFITLTGGEPFSYPALVDVVRSFDDMIFLTFTNGTLIDDRKADLIADVGNIIPAISVEGFEAETDARRGPGVYARVTAAMDRLRARGLMFGVSVTQTRENADLVTQDSFLDSYLDRGASFVWMFTYVPVGRDPELDLMATPQQRDLMRRTTMRWRRTRPVFIGDFWNDGACVGGCLSGSRYAFIAPNGDVQPCTFVHFTTHNLHNHSLREVFASPFFSAIRSAQPYSENLLRSCKIIDHPEVLRELVHQVHAKPAYPGAEAVVEDPRFRRYLDNYARDYARLADRAWAGPDYQRGHRALVPFSGLVDLYERFPERMENAARVDKARDDDSSADAPSATDAQVDRLSTPAPEQ